jgi:hypothetical protein
LFNILFPALLNPELNIFPKAYPKVLVLLLSVSNIVSVLSNPAVPAEIDDVPSSTPLALAGDPLVVLLNIGLI